MYGLVNQAIREFAIEKKGDEFWAKTHVQAGVEESHFLSDKTYDDRITYSLVGAIAENLGVTVPQALEVFGEYWIEFIDKKGFGPLLNSNGHTFLEFLSNLDQFHSRLSTAYPSFCPPDFEFNELENGQLELVYHSQRKGLAPMMSGIIRGLSKRFDTPIELESRIAETNANFLITLLTETPA